MTQEQLKEQFLQFAEFNLQEDTIIKAIIELLEQIINELSESGYISASNRLTTAELIIKEVLENAL